MSYRKQLGIEPESERMMPGVYRPQKRTGCRSARRFSPRRSHPPAAHRGCRLRKPPGPHRGCPAARSATFQTPRPRSRAPPCWLGSCDCLLRCPCTSPVHKHPGHVYFTLVLTFLKVSLKLVLGLFYLQSHTDSKCLRLYIFFLFVRFCIFDWLSYFYSE